MDPTQSAFQSGKSTLDSILLANEMVHHCSNIQKKKKKKKSDIAYIKIDFMKAFDCVGLDFLIILLEERSFGLKMASMD